VSALVPAAAEPATIRAAVARAARVAPDAVRIGTLQERDWVREFRENLAPLRFGDRLWICPEGTPCPDPAGIALVLEPGLAFGSGSHPTTAMCLAWLAGLELQGRSVLDWGCGSGVLSLAALALGARAALGVDIDDQALLATRDNAARNGLGRGLLACRPGDVTPGARHDIVVANILAGSLIELAPTLARHANAGARVALSGILVTQADEVRERCARWLTLGTAAQRDGWALLAGTPAPVGT
jgi:ribosomal protein L11 methyltransferase